MFHLILIPLPAGSISAAGWSVAAIRKARTASAGTNGLAIRAKLDENYADITTMVVARTNHHSIRQLLALSCAAIAAAKGQMRAA